MVKKRGQKLSGLSVVFPAYNDARSLPTLLAKCKILLPSLANRYEVIVVDDASEDETLEVLRRMKRTMPFLRVVTHRKNQGYGGALASGFQKAKKDFIFYTDSDGQYDVRELTKLIAKLDQDTDVVTGFKIRRQDPWYRNIIGSLYNQFTKLFLGIRVKDVDCDFRLIRRAILSKITLEVKSGAFDAELIKKLQEKNARIKEVSVSHYPRMYGNSQIFSPKRIIQSLLDLLKLTFSSLKN